VGKTGKRSAVGEGSRAEGSRAEWPETRQRANYAGVVSGSTQKPTLEPHTATAAPEGEGREVTQVGETTSAEGEARGVQRGVAVKTKTQKAVATPVLDTLLASGVVRVVDREYVGRASDGSEVNLGCVHYPESAERYLTAHPTPESW
jgi:hypothetical protein